MTWVRLADDFTDHPKVVRAGPLAAWLYVCGLTYANRYATDGLIPGAQVPRLAAVPDPERLARRLVEAGLWEEVEDGYVVHDYGVYQPSSEEIKRERADAARRQAEYRQRRADARNAARNGVTHGDGDALVTRESQPPGPARPGPVKPSVPEGSSSPLPPPPAEGERKPRRRRERIDSQQDPDAAVAPSPPEVPLSPLAPTDAELWERCREQLRSAMSPGNWSQLIGPLEPLGRAADGGLHLRAPPGLGLDRRALHYVRRALLDQGERAAPLSTISER